MGNRSRARALSVIFTCMLSSMLSGAGGERKVGVFIFSNSIPNQITWKLQGRTEQKWRQLWARSGHLHAVPGSDVFVYDLPASQVAHSTCNLDGHVNQVLLRNCLKGNEGAGDNVQLRNKQEKHRRRHDFTVAKLVYCVKLFLFPMNWDKVNYRSKTGVT